MRQKTVVIQVHRDAVIQDLAEGIKDGIKGALRHTFENLAWKALALHTQRYGSSQVGINVSALADATMDRLGIEFPTFAETIFLTMQETVDAACKISNELDGLDECAFPIPMDLHDD